jgi:hypothetical protein
MSATLGFLKKGSGQKYIKNRPYTANCPKRVRTSTWEGFVMVLPLIAFQIVPPFSIQSIQRNTLTLEPKFQKKCE